MRIEDKLVTDVPDGLSFCGYVDFAKEHHAYYVPGIAAAFLSGYAQQTGLTEPIELAEELLKLNIEGTERQFNDHTSVQICKFPWGVACVTQADTKKIDKYLPELLRMSHWFADWQNEDGSWSPSPFLNSNPSVVDKMSKTSEHIMEMNMILQALGYAKAES